MSSRKLPIVAIVGRPNVGKSTLFNRILRERKAIVHDQPGLTRDRHYGRAVYRNRPFILIDTGGYEDTTNSPLLALMREQTMIAISEADAVIFATEVDVPSDPVDAEILQKLRESGKPFFLTVNKADNFNHANQAIADFSIYGLDMVYPVSALHGEGVMDLLDDVTENFSESDDDGRDRRTGPIHVALVGRQNAGKSTLTNRLLGANRMIASDVPGTTRDSIDSNLVVDGEHFTLIDTAGIRRRGKIERGAEKLSVHSSFAAIDRCDVAMLLIDIHEGVTAQDTHIAGYVLESGKACIIVLNKWDMVEDKENYGDYIKKVREEFNFLKWAPLLTISAMTGQRTHKIWELIRHCAEQYRREFNTSDLNGILKAATTYQSPPIVSGRAISIKYVTQTGHCPPKFTFFVNDPKLIHFSYERYLMNQFRKHLDISGTPIRFIYKKRSQTFATAEERVQATRYDRKPSIPSAPQVFEITGDEEFEGELLDDFEFDDDEE